jgi:biotin transporter BioY
MNRPLRFLLCWLGMTLAPLVMFTGYLLVTRGSLRQYHVGWDSLAIAVSLAVGLASIAWLPVTSGWRWGMSALYVPVAAFLLFFYAAIFVCSHYDDCF